MGKKTFKYDKILCKKFGRNITTQRKIMGISQEELAFRANISPSYMSAIERGITDTTLSTAKRLSKGLKTSLKELLP